MVVVGGEGEVEKEMRKWHKETFDMFTTLIEVVAS